MLRHTFKSTFYKQSLRSLQLPAKKKLMSRAVLAAGGRQEAWQRLRGCVSACVAPSPAPAPRCFGPWHVTSIYPLWVQRQPGLCAHVGEFKAVLRRQKWLRSVRSWALIPLLSWKIWGSSWEVNEAALCSCKQLSFRHMSNLCGLEEKVARIQANSSPGVA